MSVAIDYPFLEYAKLLHNLGLKFVEAERSWIGYGLSKEVVLKKIPEEIKSWVRDYFSFHDTLVRLKSKIGTVIDESSTDSKHDAWMALSEETSLENCNRAQIESEKRKELLLKVKIDFNHPKIRVEQGGTGLHKENQILYIQGSMYTYHREGLNSLFHELSHFITTSADRIKTGNLESKWPKDPKTFKGTMNELKVVALTEALSDYYEIKRSKRNQFFEAMAEYPDSELFFNAHMHLVSKFSSYTAEDAFEDQISYKWFTEKEELSPAEAQRQVNYISSQILHRRHKIQVLTAFYKNKLADKYTIEHVKFMFEQQLPFLD